jgi:hypothetical protein
VPKYTSSKGLIDLLVHFMFCDDQHYFFKVKMSGRPDYVNCKGKRKVVSVHFLTDYYTMKACWGL